MKENPLIIMVMVIINEEVAEILYQLKEYSGDG